MNFCFSLIICISLYYSSRYNTKFIVLLVFNIDLIIRDDDDDDDEECLFIIC